MGKLLNPHVSVAAKNHWKKPHKKLKEKNFPKNLTCFLEWTSKTMLWDHSLWSKESNKGSHNSLGSLGTFRSVEAIDQMSSCSATWKDQFEIHDHYLKHFDIKFASQLKKRKNEQVSWTHTFLRGRTQKSPTKLVRMRNPIIHESEGFLIFSGLLAEVDCLATTWLMAKR